MNLLWIFILDYLNINHKLIFIYINYITRNVSNIENKYIILNYLYILVNISFINLNNILFNNKLLFFIILKLLIKSCI